MKRTLLFILIFLPMLVSAETVEINGIYYNLISKVKQAEVTKNPNKYSGNIIIPASVTYGGVEYSVTTIAEQAFAESIFEDCRDLTSVTIPNSVTSIGRYAFSGCRGLTSVDIPNSVMTISEQAFYYCSGLTSVGIGSNVTTISSGAFYGCGFLSSVHITDIEAWCKISFTDSGSNPLANAHHLFLNEEEIITLEIPNSVTSIGDYTFQECSGLTSVTIGNHVTSIGKYAFDNCSGLTSLTIGNSVKTIGESAFEGCGGLTSLTIPDSVTSIGNSAFSRCNGLASLTIPNSVTSIGNSTFSMCSGLTSLTIGSGVISIGEYAFDNCSGLTSVTIPGSVTSIGKSAFLECSGLTSLTIGNSVVTIGDGAFWSCSGLTSVTIPNSVTSIGDNTFYGCSGLTTVSIPGSVISIGNSAFANCSSLSSVPIGSGVTSIGKYAFDNCSGLTSVIIPGSVTTIDSYAFYGCSGITSVTIPDNVTTISDGVFQNCSGLTTVTIPNSVTTIYKKTFSGCSKLTSITIGNGVKSINEEAFAFCPEIIDVTCLAEKVPSTNSNAFKDSYIGCATLHVPAASVSAYQAVEPWKNFKEIVALKDQENMAYRPFVEDGKVWKVGDITTGNPVQLVEYYYFDGDTIIDGKTCKQMMCLEYLGPNYRDYKPQDPLRYVGAWYEEDKKVYEYDTTDKQFKLMYDFSLEDNGTFQKNDLPYVYVIGPRKTGGIKGFKGVYRDVLELADGKSYKCAPWMEGVGGIYGNPKNNVFNVELGDPGYYLMSCTVGDEVIYLNDDFEDGATPAEARKHRFDFTHTTKIQPKARMRSGAEESIYGEYNDLRLGINLEPLDDAYLVQITDESGKVVYEKNINADDIVGLNIDISAYPEGCYTVTVENSQETFTGEFEAQTTGIVEVRRNTEEIRSNIYNLQGQRLSSLQKGLNIVNGQKIYVK